MRFPAHEKRRKCETPTTTWSVSSTPEMTSMWCGRAIMRRFSCSPWPAASHSRVTVAESPEASARTLPPTGMVSVRKENEKGN